MFERLKAWLKGKDDVIRTPEDLQRALPDLKIFVLPDIPPEIKIYEPEERDSDEK